MDWEDTVVHADGCNTSMGVIGATCNCGAVRQAQISFKDGYTQRRMEEQPLVEQGKREVVTWVIRNGELVYTFEGSHYYCTAHPNALLIDLGDWQSKLKEWGIE